MITRPMPRMNKSAAALGARSLYTPLQQGPMRPPENAIGGRLQQPSSPLARNAINPPSNPGGLIGGGPQRAPGIGGAPRQVGTSFDRPDEFRRAGMAGVQMPTYRAPQSLITPGAPNIQAKVPQIHPPLSNDIVNESWRSKMIADRIRGMGVHDSGNYPSNDPQEPLDPFGGSGAGLAPSAPPSQEEQDLYGSSGSGLEADDNQYGTQTQELSSAWGHVQDNKRAKSAEAAPHSPEEFSSLGYDKETSSFLGWLSERGYYVDQKGRIRDTEHRLGGDDGTLGGFAGDPASWHPNIMALKNGWDESDAGQANAAEKQKEKIANILGLLPDAPQISDDETEAMIRANRALAAFESGRGLQAALHGAGRGRMGPGFSAGLIADTQNRSALAQGAQAAQLRAQHKLVNFQAELRQYDQVAALIQQNLALEDNAEARAAMQGIEQRRQMLQQQIAEAQQESQIWSSIFTAVGAIGGAVAGGIIGGPGGAMAGGTGGAALGGAVGNAVAPSGGPNDQSRPWLGPQWG